MSLLHGPHPLVRTMIKRTELLKRLPIITVFSITLVLAACHTLDEPPEAGTRQHASGSFIWHDLITHDLQQAKAFYGDLFNWTFEQAQERDGNPYTLARIEDRYSVGMLEVPRPADGANYTRWLGYLTVEQLDTAISATLAAGGQRVSSAVERNKIGRAVAIQDPEQAVLGLIETGFNISGLVLRQAPGAVIWNELLSDDPEAASAFYSALAGVRAETVERRGGDYTILSSGNEQAAGILENPFQSAGPLWLTYIAVLDPAATAARVEALGGKVLIAPTPRVREGSMALIQDPGGAILALQKWPGPQRG